MTDFYQGLVDTLRDNPTAFVETDAQSLATSVIKHFQDAGWSPPRSGAGDVRIREIHKVLLDFGQLDKNQTTALGAMEKIDAILERPPYSQATDGTAVEAGKLLRSWIDGLHKPDESEEDYGYRQAYERICDWLEFEFPRMRGGEPR